MKIWKMYFEKEKSATFEVFAKPISAQGNLIIPNPDLNMKGILLHLTFQSVSAICFLNQYIDERIAANSKYCWTDIENTLLIATKTNTHMEKPGGK